ncbi:hypothetical protein MMC30_004435 [Trapelia coarctata]|nr:hypothetical protein [Trapelia coarctata]
MPRKRWIDKSTSTTYALVHRPQNDPKIHDASSSSMVFQELAPSQAHKIKSRNDLESELFGSESGEGDEPRLRDNEGEAAEYGIYYDDTEYDYMQHMRDLNGGNGSGESYFVEAPVKKEKGKGKEKVKLEDALRGVSLEDSKRDTGASLTGQQLLDEDILPSKILKKTTYQDQQDVPDVLAGFQPDMDPRLREVLEALEDEAYVDDEEDLFGELAKDRQEISLAEFEELGFDEEGDNDDDGGWDTDDTAKPKKGYKDSGTPPKPRNVDQPSEATPDHGEGDWMAEFSKFKNATKASKADKAAAPSNAELQSSIMTGTSMTGGRRKKRKGAMTSSTGYSMTSSSLFRTEGLTLLDARFDKIEEDYADNELMDDDDDGAASVMTGQMSNVSGLSRASNMSSASKWSTTSRQTPNLVMRKDFDGIMDEFLGGYSMSGKRRVKKGGYQSGMEQLDEIRRELGKPRIAAQKAV